MAIHSVKVARLFASQLFQPFPNLPIFERKNVGFSIVNRCVERVLMGIDPDEESATIVATEGGENNLLADQG